MFKSTVIQFGTDQMIEDSSNQLSTFIYTGTIGIYILAMSVIGTIGAGLFWSSSYQHKVPS